MKRLLVLFLAAWLVLPIPHGNRAGVFNRVSNLIWCTTPESCLHERAHFLDKQNGWISDSPEFAQAIQVYVLTNHDESSLRVMQALLTSKQIAHRELYAEIYSWSGGSVPDSLKPFYPETGTRFYVIRLRNWELHIPAGSL